MNRDDAIELIGFLNRGIDREYLEGLTSEELHSYVVHLKAVRLKTLTEQRMERYAPQAVS